MKKTIGLFLAMMLSMPMAIHADSYTQLWKQVTTAQNSDLPKTEIEVLRKIQDKATHERAYGHLIKALLYEVGTQAMVSGDSLPSGVQRIERMEAQARDEALRAVYQSVLGRIYQENRELADDAAERSKKYYAQSLSQPNVLAKSLATDYEPAVVDGIDSRYFGDDLLHVLGMEADNWQLLHDWYDSHGKREAACLCALHLVKRQRPGTEMALRKSKYLQTVDSLIETYKDLPVAGEVAIEHYTFMDQATDATVDEKIAYINYALSRWGSWPRMNVLRNAQGRLTLPSFHVSIGNGVLLPGQPREVVIMSIVNVQTLTMTVQRIDVDGDTKLNPSYSDDYAKLKKRFAGAPVCTQTRRYVGLPNYRVTRDTMTIGGLPTGVYLVEFSTDNSQIRPERLLLRVSDLTVVHEELPGKNIRMAAVSATTGQPVAGAKIRLTTRTYYNEPETVETFTTDSNGEVAYHYERYNPYSIYVYTDTDRAMDETNFASGFSYSAPSTKMREELHLYTDRSLYRPGQQVQVGVIAYTLHGNKEMRVGSGRTLTLTLRDANSKNVDKQEVSTDEFGMASATFTLPQGGLTGLFSISCWGNGYHGYTSFSVEEYKRPTFEVEFEKVTEKYVNGDTVSVYGTARSFAGVPVQGAKVALSVVRRPSRWWWYRSSRDVEKKMAVDTLTTDADGRFEVRVPMVMPDTWDERQVRYYSFDIMADVTDVAGETRHGELSLPLSDKSTALSCNLPQKVLKDSLHTITFSYCNNAGEPIDATLHYRFDKGAMQTARTHVATPIGQSLTTGLHTLTAICGTDTISQEVIVFSMNDKRPVVETHDWFYTSGTTFPRDGGPIYIQVGSSDADQHILYTILSGNDIVESGTIDQSQALTTRPFRYKEEYGDGLLLTYAWVKNGVFYRHSTTIRKPLPDKRLRLSWKTFRDRLTPGQKEEWTLHVEHPDGRPADGQLMAVLYDKSLDMIRQHRWYFSPSFQLSLPSTTWHSMEVGNRSAYGEMYYKSLAERSLDFSHLNKDMFPGSSVYYSHRLPDMVLMESRAMMKMRAAGNMMENESVAELTTDAAESKDAGEATDTETSTGSQTQLRENLSETAFFYPGLTTDTAGNIGIRFTLPESVTTWRFIGLAHDRDVNYGMLEDEAVAQKTVMVQPNMPRFLRTGDRSTIATRIINTSEKAVSGTARLTLIDADSEKTVYTQSSPYSIEAGQTTSVSFDYAPTTDNTLLICRITAEGRDYGDGEQHYLPVLPDEELVTNTYPFTQDEPGTKTIDLDQLFPAKTTGRKLTVEYTNHPAWLMIQALPSVAYAYDDNALSLATAYYANTIADHLLKQSPTIKQVVELWKQETGRETSLMSSLEKNQELKTMILSETPWVMDAERESDQKQALINYFDEIQVAYRLSNDLEKLKKLQNADGSFSWWPGMTGSRYITTTVCEMFLRLYSMTGTQNATSALVTKALKFMTKQAHEEVQELKKLEKKGYKHLRPSEMAIGYLYARALDNKKLSGQDANDAGYLVNLLEKKTTEFSIYGKARSAIILNWAGKTTKAKEYIESIRQYTVYKEEMGRYFDTGKALYSWRDYRIPSQVAAIEALKALEPQDRKTVMEMQRWLLQEKRTQAWNTPINSADAVYAFLNGESSKLETLEAPLTTLKIDGQQLDTSKATAGLGYVKHSLPAPALHTFTAEKTSTGTSWGAVYAQFMQKSTDIASATSGLSVKREVLSSGQLKTGDRVKVRITITADRDYDFVQLTDKRAACLEPIGQLSGYRRGYYCAPRDNATHYYFDILPKGKHVIETEYYIDRPGQYQTGICTVQCAYSPEFMGRERASVINVSDR